MLCHTAENAKDRLWIVRADGGCVPSTKITRIVQLISLDAEAAEATLHARPGKCPFLDNLAAVIAELAAAKRPQRAEFTHALLRIQCIIAHLALLERVIVRGAMPHSIKAIALQDAACELVDVHLRQRHIGLVMQFVRVHPLFFELLPVLRRGLIYRHLMIRRYTVGLLFEISLPIHEGVRHLTGAPIQLCCRRTRPDEIDLLVGCGRLKELFW